MKNKKTYAEAELELQQLRRLKHDLERLQKKDKIDRITAELKKP